jgi:hypothetical protein
VPLELQAAHTRLRISHEEPKDALAALREANARKTEKADYGL